MLWNRCICWIGVVFFLAIVSRVYSEAQGSSQNKILVLTIPKAGTHLMMKVVEMIAQEKFYPFNQTTVREKAVEELCEGEDRLFIDHLLPNYDFLKSDQSDKYIKVVLVRDLRDVCLSYIYWIHTLEMALMPERIKRVYRWPLDERLSKAIMQPDANCGTGWFARNALEWIKNPTVFVCRFEDLVGPLGGGSRNDQEATIEALGKHLGYELSKERVAEIADTLFGGTLTFRKGQIGEWREHFSPQHIDLFKSALGKELIELGYESDNNW
jgi:sulfotransferase 6B1